jgi:hypothetical protein
MGATQSLVRARRLFLSRVVEDRLHSEGTRYLLSLNPRDKDAASAANSGGTFLAASSDFTFDMVSSVQAMGYGSAPATRRSLKLLR